MQHVLVSLPLKPLHLAIPYFLEICRLNRDWIYKISQRSSIATTAKMVTQPTTNGHTNGLATGQTNGNAIKTTTSAPDPTKQLIHDLEGTNTLPLWAQMAKYNPPAPNPKAIPHIWRYEEIKPHLLRAGDLITEKQAERRVLMMINPERRE